MDELEVLRLMRSEDNAPDDAVMTRGRARLEREIAAREHGAAAATALSNGKARARRRAPAILLGGVAAAAALGIGFAILGPGAPSPRAQAAEMLEDAADHLRTENFSLAPGEFLRIEETRTGLGEAPLAGAKADIPGETIKYRESETIITYVPSDIDDDWTVRRSGRALDEVLDAHGDPDAAGTVNAALRAGPGAGEERLPGGRRSAEDPDPLHREAPTDPEKLRDFIEQRTAAHQGSADESIFEWLLPVVSNPAASPELRAAGFEVLAGLGGISAEDDEARTVTIALGDESERRLAFDADGELVSVQEMLVGESGWLGGLEPGAVLSSIAIDSRVVRGIPKTE